MFVFALTALRYLSQ